MTGRAGFVVAELIALLACGALAQAQQAAQLFDAPVIAVPDDQQRMNALLDLDGDGWTDAVGTFWPMSNRVGVYGFRNDGAGRLVPLFGFEWTQYGNNDMPFPIAVGDLDGDGRDDFVAGVRDQLEVFRSNGPSAPLRLHEVITGSGNEIQDLQLGDYDGDGVLEAAVRMMNIYTDTDTGIRIYDNLLTAPTATHFLLPPAGTGFVMENADANGDGVTDLMCIGSRVDLFTVSGGALVPAGSHTHGLPGMPAGGGCDDLDGDGDADIVVFGGGGQHRVLRRQSSAVFAWDPIETGGPATDLADVDGDGDLDGVCCGGGGPSTYTNGSPSWFEIAINDGNAVFAPSFKLASMGANHIAGVDDLDHDGDADLVAGRIVYYNVHGIEPAGYPTTTGFVLAESVHDVDGDGDPDVGSGLGAFERNRGDGVFEPASRIAPFPPPGSMFGGPGYAGDFDGDGDVDLIVHELQGGAVMNERLLLNNGGGGLADGGPVTAPGVSFTPGASPHDALVADVNGDGRADVVARESTGVPVTRIFLQGTSGLFVESASFTGDFAQAVADLDQDGSADLVLLSPTGMQIRFGDPSGSMAAVLAFSGPSGSFPIMPSVIAADLDGDGDDDVLGPVHLPGDPIAKAVRVLENAGARQFLVRDGLFPGYEGFLLPAHAADLDGDGAMDVLLGQRRDAPSGDTLPGSSVYLGSNAPGLDFTSQGGEQYPLLWTLADLDGDGDVDGIGNDTVYYNHAFSAPEGGRRLQYGTATPGSGWQAPTIGAIGPFRDGGPIELRITGAAPNALGFLILGTGNGSFPLAGTGGSLEVLPLLGIFPIAFPSASGLWGTGAYSLTLWVPEGVAGLSFHHQAVTIDPAAQGGVAVSNALEIDYGD